MQGAHIRTFQPSDQAWIVRQHAELYRDENGFEDTFGPVVQEVLNGLAVQCDARRAQGWIAEDKTARLGCIFCQGEDENAARLRLFLLVPSARGRGLGKALLKTCMHFAQAQGFSNIWLTTHESHTAACRLYRDTGWQMESAEPVRSYGCDLVEQRWRYRF